MKDPPGISELQSPVFLGLVGSQTSVSDRATGRVSRLTNMSLAPGFKSPDASKLEYSSYQKHPG